MGLKRMWRGVQLLSERPHNLIAISDLHLGCDLRAGMKKEAWSRPRPADVPLASFLDWHATHREGGKPWRLILNGDIVDFIAISATPSPGEPVPFTVSPEERSIGLAPEEQKCVWKLQRTAQRHPQVFDALARFLHKGNSLHIIRGNHDSEWRWPAVQEEFCRILADRGSALSVTTRRRIEPQIEFHDWFYLEPGFFYAEHGHAHDHYSVHPDFFAAQGEQPEQPPISSKVLRYFVNRYTEQVEIGDDVDAWGLREYLDWVLKAGNPLRVVADYLVMVFRVIYPIVWQSLRISRAFARLADRVLGRKVEPSAHVRRILARFQGTEKQAQQLLAIASRPAEQSLFDSMQLFYLDRMMLALLCLFCAWSTSQAVHGFWAKGGALTVVGIVFAALNALLSAMRKTDTHPMLLQAARRVAQVFDVKYVVMGHSHRPVDEMVGNGARYFNLGSWTGRSVDGFPHVGVSGERAALRRWTTRPEQLPLPAPEIPAPMPIPA
jgi:UDP-2,3-diacylglucosamine pyrophosphatase LpxH